MFLTQGNAILSPGEAGGDGGEAQEDSGAAEFMESLNNEFGSLRSELAETKKAASKADRLEQGLKELVGGKKEPENPMGWYDNILDSLMEAEKNGQKMPLTGQIATVLAQVQKQALEQQRIIDELRNQVKSKSDPQLESDRRAYSYMDDQVTNVLEQMYGEVDDALHDAISGKITDVIKELQRDAPEKWEKIRRSETNMTKLTRWAAQSIIPPKARQALQREAEDAQPITEDTFARAWAELKQLPDSPQRDKAATLLRQQQMEFKFNGARRYNRA